MGGGVGAQWCSNRPPQPHPIRRRLSPHQRPPRPNLGHPPEPHRANRPNPQRPRHPPTLQHHLPRRRNPGHRPDKRHLPRHHHPLRPPPPKLPNPDRHSQRRPRPRPRHRPPHPPRIPPGQTTIAYRYEATIGGKVASLGGRLLDGAARVIIAQFFTALAAKAGARRPGILSRLLRWLGLRPEAHGR